MFYCNSSLYLLGFFSLSWSLPFNSFILILIITGSIYFILLDELIMGSAQRRIGPFNLGLLLRFKVFWIIKKVEKELLIKVLTLFVLNHAFYWAFDDISLFISLWMKRCHVTNWKTARSINQKVFQLKKAVIICSSKLLKTP